MIVLGSDTAEPNKERRSLAAHQSSGGKFGIRMNCLHRSRLLRVPAVEVTLDDLR